MSPIAGAVPFSNVTPAGLELGGLYKESGATWADVDNDGDWDLFAPVANGSRLWIRDPASPAGFADDTLTRIPLLTVGSATRNILVADFDNDGAVDIFRNQDNQGRVWLNDGAGNFSEAALFTQDDIPGTGITDLEGAGVLDYDLDGDLDVLLTNSDTANLVLVNSGDGRVWDIVMLTNPPATDSDYAVVLDFDRDQDIDLFLRTTDAAEPDAWFSDAGQFVVDPSLLLESDSPVHHVANQDGKGALFACDMDLDGQFELFSTQTLRDLEPSRFYDWDGVAFSALSVPAVVPDIPANSGVTAGACGDVDNDGLVDLVLGDQNMDHLYRQGTGWSREEWGTDHATVGVSLADWDSDGDLDVYTVSNQLNALWENLDPVPGNHLQVRLQAATGACPDRARRDDIGGQALLRDGGGEIVGGVQEINAGGGRGGSGWPVMHWGVADPAAAVVVEVDFLYGGAASYTVEVRPDEIVASSHLLVLSTDDHDGDGILNVHEPVDDLDGDGFPAGVDRDSDADGFPDAAEAADTDPCTAPVDTDGDLLPDAFDEDSDNDGLTDAAERTLHGTDPLDTDTDGGGRSDGDEVFDQTNPLDGSDDQLDTDGDGLADDDDPVPGDVDADDDGLSDGDEVRVEFTDPLSPDTDGDGIQDGTELGVVEPTAGTTPSSFVPDLDPSTVTGPTDADSDGDALGDGEEDTNANGLHEPPETDPTRLDTDGGGVDDGRELDRGTDPNVASDDSAPGPLRSGANANPPASVGCGCGVGGPSPMPWFVAVLLLAVPRRSGSRRSGYRGL